MKSAALKPTKTLNYNNSSLPKNSIDELAEKWVEMMIEMLLAKDKGGLQKSDIFPKLETAWFA